MDTREELPMTEAELFATLAVIIARIVALAFCDAVDVAVDLDAN